MLSEIHILARRHNLDQDLPVQSFESGSNPDRDSYVKYFGDLKAYRAELKAEAVARGVEWYG